MSIIAECLRPFWAPGLNEITGNATKDLRNWLAGENYQIYSQSSADEFSTSFSEKAPFLGALAADVNRMASAAYESIIQAKRSDTFPRSTAWMIIKSYYASFFAAHAITRMIGRSLVTLDFAHVRSVNKIASLFGMWTEDVRPGYFACEFLRGTQKADWRRVDSSLGGVHERFWSYFESIIRGISAELLSIKAGMVAENQQVSVKLAELADNLCYRSSTRGTWLSSVRNRVNYRHEFGAWYPYRGQNPSGTVEERLVNDWLADPMSLNLTSHNDRELRRFQATCAFIIATCRELAADMAERCPVGRSFQHYGWLAIARIAQQKSGRTAAA